MPDRKDDRSAVIANAINEARLDLEAAHDQWDSTNSTRKLECAQQALVGVWKIAHALDLNTFALVQLQTALEDLQRGRRTDWLLNNKKGKGSPMSVRGMNRQAFAVCAVNILREGKHYKTDVDAMKYVAAKFEPVGVKYTDLKNWCGLSSSENVRQYVAARLEHFKQSAIARGSWPARDRAEAESMVQLLAELALKDWQSTGKS
jgi:hypothetical protein